MIYVHRDLFTHTLLIGDNSVPCKGKQKEATAINSELFPSWARKRGEVEIALITLSGLFLYW